EEPVSDFLFENLWHPYEPQEATVTQNEFALSDVILAVTHKARRNVSAAYRTGKRGEFHAAGSHAGIITVYRHDSVAHRQDSRDTLATPASGHRVVYQAVEIVAGNRLPRCLINEVVYALPVAQLGIHGLTLLNRLVWTRRIDFKRSLAVEPVICAAQARALRAYHADVRRSKRLAQRAGVVCFSTLIRHALDAFITCSVGLLGNGEHFFYLGLIGVDLDLTFVEDSAEILMIFSMQDFSYVFEGKSLINCLFADSVPGYIALAYMHKALGIVYQVVHLALKDRLIVFLHLPAGNFGHYRHRQTRAGSHVFDIRADHFNPAVFDLAHIGNSYQLEAGCLSTAALKVYVVLAHALTLESRAVRDGNRDLGNGHLEPADFDRFCRDLFVRYAGNDMFIGANTRGENFGNIGVGDSREAPVDRPGCIGCPLGVNFAESVHERENTILVILQNRFEISGLDPAEGHGGPVCETKRKYRCGNIGTERHKTRVPSDFHTRLDELLGKRGARLISAHEDVEVLLLIIFGNHFRDFRIGGRADNCGKPRGAAVNEFDTPLSHDGIIGGAKPDLSTFHIAFFALMIKIGIFYISDRLDHFFSQNGGHSGIQRSSQVRKGNVVLGFDVRGQKHSAFFHYRLGVGQFFDFDAEDRVNDGK